MGRLAIRATLRRGLGRGPHARYRLHRPAPACTGLAYLLYFRLIDRVGPARAIAVTFLVPMFGIAFGALFLGEAIGWRMIAGSAVVLLGTALATGLLRRR